MKKDRIAHITAKGEKNMLRPGKRVFLAALLFPFFCFTNASAMTIVTSFIGGAAPANAVGGGDLSEIVNAAARMWESVYSDSATITIYYGWGVVGDAGTHTLIGQGDQPNREISGMIIFDNSGSNPFYLDPTPNSNEEYHRRTEEYQDFGGGLINVARLFSQPVGDAVGHIDLLSVALHEMGHAMGLSSANTSFMAQSGSGYINISENLPYAGTAAPLSSNYSGIVPHFDPAKTFYGCLMSGINADERRIPSELDIVANAQLSGFAIQTLYPKQTSQYASNQTESTSSSRPAPIKRPTTRSKASGLWERVIVPR
jgi:hypothetical protein